MVGWWDMKDFELGDTLRAGRDVAYEELPQFAPDCVVVLHSPSTSQFIRFWGDLQQVVGAGSGAGVQTAPEQDAPAAAGGR